MLTDQTLQELGKQFGLMIDWSNENIIPYLKELAQRVVQYETWQSIVWLIIGILIIILGIILIILELKNVIDADGFFTFIGLIGIIIGIVIICCQVDDILLCKYLPEKILLRYIKRN
jgi:hypothetical protein